MLSDTHLTVARLMSPRNPSGHVRLGYHAPPGHRPLSPFSGRAFRVLTVSLTVLAGAAACATTPSREVPSHAATGWRRTPYATAPSTTVIPASELATQNGGDLMRAVSRLRPEFSRLRNPSFQSPDGYQADVYIDDMRHGGFDMLAEIPLAMVREVRLVSPFEATTRFGGAHPGGTLIVRTR